MSYRLKKSVWPQIKYYLKNHMENYSVELPKCGISLKKYKFMEPNQIYSDLSKRRDVFPWDNSGQARCFTVKMMVAFLAWWNARSEVWFDLVWFFLKIYRGLKYNFRFFWSSISLTKSIVETLHRFPLPYFFTVCHLLQNSTIGLLYCPLPIFFFLLFL